MKIVRLEASNVKRLKAVEITPDGNVVTITGANGAGKTSVLDAVMYALCGKETHAQEVIRRGEERAHVTVDLGDLVVERRWTSNDRSTVTVKSQEGAKYSSPQAMLDKLVGRIAFDPLSFNRLEPKKQVEVVRQLAGLDFSELDGRRAALYEQRTEVNRESTRLKARLEQLPDVGEVEAVSLGKLLAEQDEAIRQKQENDRVRSEYSKAQERYTSARDALDAATNEVAELERKLEEARDRVKQRTEQLDTIVSQGKAARAAVDALVEPDLDGIRARIRDVEQSNELARKAKERAQVAADLDSVQAKLEQLNESIDACDAEKAITLERAQFPIEGLGFTESGVTFRGLPLSQASAAEQLRVSIAIGLALNPKVRVLLIRDASLLDRASLRAVHEMASAADAQVWLERVAGEGETGILIEDGQIAGADLPPGFEAVQHAS